MIYRITHRTTYDYEEPVDVCHNLARLTPLTLGLQSLRSFRLDVDPAPSSTHDHVDYFGNRVTAFVVSTTHDHLEIVATSEVETAPSPPLEPNPAPWEAARDALEMPSDPETRLAREAVLDSPMIERSPALRAFATKSFPEGRPLREGVTDLMHRIHTEFAFDPEATTLRTSIHEVLENRRGVCQDFAHVAIGALRSLGLAARYVSGYLETVPPPGKPKLIGADASHAWCTVYEPGLGWLDFDPTNDQQPNERYVRVAIGRDYSDVPPLNGVSFGGGAHTLDVGVDVVALDA